MDQNFPFDYAVNKIRNPVCIMRPRKVSPLPSHRERKGIYLRPNPQHTQR